MIVALLDCQHWVNTDVESLDAGFKVGSVVECMNCSTFDTFRTVRVIHMFRLVRCALNGETIGIHARFKLSNCPGIPTDKER